MCESEQTSPKLVLQHEPTDRNQRATFYEAGGTNTWSVR